MKDILYLILILFMICSLIRSLVMEIYRIIMKWIAYTIVKIINIIKMTFFINHITVIM